MAKVSIIIPIYNAEKFLSKCLDSVVNQTFRDIEIICVNDGSKDNSLNKLKEYQKKDDRIIIIDKKNEGVSAARNEGIMKSTGEYITFADADDWLELDAIESVYDVITEKNVDIVNFNCWINDSYDTPAISCGNMHGLEGKFFETSQSDFVDQVSNKILNGELNCAVWLLMIRKEILLKTSLFSKGISYAEDCILYNELLDKINTIYFFDKCAYHYYQNLNSCTRSNKYYVQNIYSSARAYEKLVYIIENDKFEKKNRLQITANRFGKYIMKVLFLIYLENTNEKFNQMLKEMLNDKTIPLIVKETSIKGLPLHMALPYKLFAKKKYKTLILFYKFRKICRDFKIKIKDA